LNFYKHHLGDYAAKTAHLSWDEDCAYRRLIDIYYKRETPIPADIKDAARLARATTPGQRKAIEAVLHEFFDLRDDGWHQKRCDEEIAQANAQAETNRRIAEDREAKRRARMEHESLNARANDPSTNRVVDNNTNRSEVVNLAISQTPDSRLQTPKEQEITNLPVGPARPPAEQPPQLAGVDPPKAPPEPPDCPHQAILALWAEVLPALPRHLPDQWKGTRADHLRARWREAAVAKSWDSQAQGIAYFRKVFAHVGRSDFLTGRAPPQQGRRPFVVELEWLVNPTNWAKTLEGKYHPEEVTP
jgi:uncharacterized protein YdaU (DUF1376 family)